MPDLSPDIFALDYDAACHILLGRWLRPTIEADLYPSYEKLLAAAHAHGKCRYWLLDMRRRDWHSATFAKWFGELLAKQVVQELGSPVFIAYVADESHRAAIESAATEAMLRQSAQAEFYPYFFNNEEAAREWLLYHQAHLDQRPVMPQH